jgi:hypothetical protein
MLNDRKLQGLRDAYEIAYNEAVRLGYEVLETIDKADKLGNRDSFFRAAERAKAARDRWAAAGEQVGSYLRG